MNTTTSEMFLLQLDELVGRLKDAVRQWPADSEALSFAVEAGLPPQMAYTVTETARYTGISFKTLYKEIDAGRLQAIIPRGSERGAVIRVAEVDRWMRESVK